MEKSRAVWVAGAAIAGFCTLLPPAAAETPAAFLQDSTIVGAAGTLTASRVPVQTSTGRILYQDITIQFKTSTTGKLSLAPGYPKFEPSQPLITSGFLAGTYGGPATVASGKFLVNVTGPGVGTGGETAWSLAAAKGANICTVPLSATWYTGPAAGNPLAARLKRVGITFAAYSYGVIGGSVPGSCNNGSDLFFPFRQGALIGVSQTEGSLTIVSFSANGTVGDSKTPVAQITYTLLP